MWFWVSRLPAVPPLPAHVVLFVSDGESEGKDMGGVGRGCAPGISIRVYLWDCDLEYVDVVVIVRVRTRVLIQVICSVTIQPSYIVQGSC